MEKVSEEEEFLNLGERDERYISEDSSIGPRWMIWRRRRDILCLLAYLGYANVTILRSNLSVAIVAMTSEHPITLGNGTVILEKEFNWDAVTRGHVLSAFFYGYTVTQIPGGWLAIRFGGHRTYGMGILVSAVFTILTPALAGVHVYLLIAVRFVVGLSEGFTHTGIEILVAQWIPKQERNLMVGLLSTGLTFGNIVSMAMLGYVASYLGWRAIFYITGAIGVVWVFSWWYLVSDSPQTDTRITLAEQNYIRKNAAFIANKKIALNVPWLQILTSVPMWSGIFVVFVTSWNFNVLSIQMPSYFKEKLRIDLNKAGLLSAIPYVFSTLVIVVNGYLLDLALSKKWLTVTQLRKISICTALVTTSLMLLLLGHIDMRSTYPVVLCVVVAVSCDYFSSICVYYNFLDLAPQFSSIMTGFAHVISSASAAITTVITGHIVRNKTAEEWRMVFSISSGIGLAGAAVYGFLGTGELQRWAATHCSEEEIARPQNKTTFDEAVEQESVRLPVNKAVTEK